MLQVGAGGAGTAIALALLEAGVAELALHDADPARRDALVGRLRERVRRPGRCRVTTDPTGFDIVANATPMGMRPGDPYPVDVTRLKPGHLRRRRRHQAGGPTVDRGGPRGIGCGTSTGSDMFAAVADLIVDFLLADGPLKGQ